MNVCKVASRIRLRYICVRYVIGITLKPRPNTLAKHSCTISYDDESPKK